MRIQLKGVHRVRRQLKDGTTTTYYYAWRGGPRLEGVPRSPEFLASFQSAHATRGGEQDGTLAALIRDYKRSSFFLTLGDRMRTDYTIYLSLIEQEFGTMPIKAVPVARRVFKDWRQSFADTPRKADLAWTVLRRVLNVAIDSGVLKTNPCAGGGKLSKSDRSAQIWTEDQIAAFKAKAPRPLRHAMQLALDTGQRQGDMLRLTWSAYDGEYITLRQSKTDKRVSILVTSSLKGMLDAMPRVSTQILTNTYDRPWTSDGFKSSWASACKAAGISGVTFHDLRGTAVVRLAEASCTEPEIAAITGHSLANVKTLLEAYWTPTKAQAASAIRKLEGTKSGTKL